MLTPVKELLDWEGSLPKFTEEDESTLHPRASITATVTGSTAIKVLLHLQIPGTTVIAQSVAKRFGYPEPDLEDDRRRGFLVDDLECCN